MRAVEANGILLHVREDGDPAGVPVVFANSLGTDLRLWDAVLPLLPPRLRFIRYDARGHGLSDCPPGPYSIDDLAADAAALIRALGAAPAIFVGLSIGGMVAQRVAALHPDLVRGLVLSNTAARMGDPAMWRQRIEMIERDGLPSVVDGILDRWFAPAFRHGDEARLWGAMLARTPAAGYLGCCAAIAEADLRDGTGALRLPTLAIGGSHDGSSPPDTVAATAALIPGAECRILEGAGHLPCVEAPGAYAAVLAPFLEELARA